MNLYFLILAFSIVEVYSYERFIKTAIGPTTVYCDQNSFFMANSTKYMSDCNHRSSCHIRSSNHLVNYVCIKRKYEKSACNSLTRRHPDVYQNGCYIGNFDERFEISLPKNVSEMFHVFVLYKSIGYYIEKTRALIICPAFYYYKCRHPCRINMDGNSMILFKVSNKTEDFGEFFGEANPKTTTKRKDDDITHPMNFAPTKSMKAINKPFTVSSLDHGDNSSTKETPKNVEEVFIILGAIVIVLMIIFVLVAFIFYRHKLQKAKKKPEIVTTNYANENLFSGNEEAIDANTYANVVPRAGEDFNNDDYSSLDNTLYETSYSVDQSQPKAQNQSGNKETAPISDAVYAVVNKQKGQKDDGSVPPGGSWDQSQPKAQNQSGNKETAPISEAVYAVVNKQKVLKDDGSVPPGNSSHVVVNGDLYAVVNKQEPNYTLYL